MRIVRMEQSTQNKYQELQNAVYNNNERINIITKDMEALLNNDKLLLDKLIEKNIVSTIQEEEEKEKENEQENEQEQELQNLIRRLSKIRVYLVLEIILLTEYMCQIYYEI